MSAAYEGQDPMVIAKQAERDLNSQKAPLSDSSKFCLHQRTALQPSSIKKLTPLPSQPKSPA
jgi:hypothetical protein